MMDKNKISSPFPALRRDIPQSFKANSHQVNYSADESGKNMPQNFGSYSHPTQVFPMKENIKQYTQPTSHAESAVERPMPIMIQKEALRSYITGKNGGTSSNYFNVGRDAPYGSTAVKRPDTVSSCCFNIAPYAGHLTASVYAKAYGDNGSDIASHCNRYFRGNNSDEDSSKKRKYTYHNDNSGYIGNNTTFNGAADGDFSYANNSGELHSVNTNLPNYLHLPKFSQRQYPLFAYATNDTATTTTSALDERRSQVNHRKQTYKEKDESYNLAQLLLSVKDNNYDSNAHNRHVADDDHDQNNDHHHQNNNNNTYNDDDDNSHNHPSIASTVSAVNSSSSSSSSAELKKKKKYSTYRSNCNSTWSTEEDEKLRESIQKHGTHNWDLIAQPISGRTGKQCRERWCNQLDTRIVKTDWTVEEDIMIESMHNKLGNQWAKITKFLPGRTDNAVKNRFHLLCRRVIRQLKKIQGKSNGFKQSIDDEASHRLQSLITAAALTVDQEDKVNNNNNNNNNNQH